MLLSSTTSVFCVLKCSLYKSFTFLIRFILRYFIHRLQYNNHQHLKTILYRNLKTNLEFHLETTKISDSQNDPEQ